MIHGNCIKFQISVSMNTVMVIHLHINYDCKVGRKTIWPAKSEIFAIWPLKKKFSILAMGQKHFVLPTGGNLMDKGHKNRKSTLNISSHFLV